MDATCTIQDSIHVFNLVHKYVSRILGTYHLCRGVYVFIGRVEAGSMIGNMSYNSRGDALTTVYGFLRGLLMYLQPEYNCISRETVSYTSRGTIPHIVTNYPRAYIQRRTEHFRCACNQTRVCRRKGSGRRHPTEMFRPAFTCQSGESVDLQVYRHYRVQNRGCCLPR